MSFLTEGNPLFQGPRQEMFGKKKIRSRNIRQFTFRGLSAEDNILGLLTRALRFYPIKSESESLANSIIGLEDISNMNIQYLAAALFVYSFNSTKLNKKTKDKVDNITEDMFDDSTIPMKKIRERLQELFRSDVDWIRRKQNILVYLSKILIYYSEEHEIYNPSTAYRKIQKETAFQEDEDEKDIIIEYAEGGGYNGTNTKEAFYDPDD
jgi:hypothetical protein